MLAYERGGGRGTLVELPRLEPTAAREALEPVFGSFEEARAVFLPWVPCTRASGDRRLQAIDAIRATDAGIGFELMLAIWPRLQDSSSPTHIPRFREWQRDSERGSLPEILEFVSGLVPRALEDAAAEPRRWVELVDRVAVVPEGEQEQMLSARFLRALPPGDATSELADAASDEARARYWAEVEPFTSGAEAEARGHERRRSCAICIARLSAWPTRKTRRPVAAPPRASLVAIRGPVSS